jgi:hypothetical protein
MLDSARSSLGTPLWLFRAFSVNFTPGNLRLAKIVGELQPRIGRVVDDNSFSFALLNISISKKDAISSSGIGYCITL